MKSTAAAASRRTSSALDCAQSTRRVAVPLLCDGEPAVQEERPGQRRPDPGEAPGAGHRLAGGVEQLGRRRRRFRVGVERRDQGRARPRPQLRVLVQQQAVAALRLAHQGRVVLRLAGPPLQRDQADVAAERPHRLGRAVVGGVVEDEDLALHPGRVGALDRGQAGEQVLAAVRVHDAVGERGRQAGHDNRLTESDTFCAPRHYRAMKVQLVDPSAFTPPYDRALAAALARGGAEVELLTSRFLYGAGPAGRGLPGRGALLPPQRRPRPRRARPRPLQGGRARPRHAALPPRRRRRRRPLPVADDAGPRRPPAAEAAPAGDDRPLHPAARPEPPPGRQRPPRLRRAWTPSSPTPSTAPPASATRSGSTPPRSASSPTAPSTTSPGCRRRSRCRPSWREPRAR